MNYIETLRTHSVNECDRILRKQRRWRNIGIGAIVVFGSLAGYVIAHELIALVSAL
jgi:hypothetical protein